MIPNNAEIPSRIEIFKRDLERVTDTRMVQRYITSGECFLFSPESHFELKSVVAAQFGLHHSQILITGSAKLGFSIAPTKRFQHFRDESDIDIAIVSPELFESVWKEVFEFSNSGGVWDNHVGFKDYLFRGWIRPDKMPIMHQSDFQDRWWEFFRDLTSSGDFGQYKLSAGLYKSWGFLELYLANAVSGCRGH